MIEDRLSVNAAPRLLWWTRSPVLLFIAALGARALI
jgi:hypothetical protein